MLDKQTMEQLKFDEKGLIPAIVVDGTTGQVLTLAYMNKESSGHLHQGGAHLLWSRSRQELWRKGRPPGRCKDIIDITADCDYDALVVRVNKEGPACHTGAESCFHNPSVRERGEHRLHPPGPHGHAPGPEGESQGGVLHLLPLRKGHRQDPQKRWGEESTEVIIAGKAEDKKETIYEIADLAYHVMVLMLQLGISLEEVRDEPPGTSSTKR